jgi:hypothetical protein
MLELDIGIGVIEPIDTAPGYPALVVVVVAGVAAGAIGIGG